MAYVVIYLWRGERHRTEAFTVPESAVEMMRGLRAGGFPAWIEVIR